MKFASALLLFATWLRAGVYFEPNLGQVNHKSAFVARTAAGSVGINSQGMEIVRRDGTRATVRLDGARINTPGFGEKSLQGVNHYALDRDPAKWIWDVKRYSRVRFRQVYPGIDVLYHAEQGKIEFDFLVAPGAEPASIALGLPVAAMTSDSGDLTIGPARLRSPNAWQMKAGERVPVDVKFIARGRRGVGFRLGAYDRSLPLVIDPIVEFATYLGGSDNEGEPRIVAGADGAIYVAGATISADFPASLPTGSILNRPEILLAPDVYVARLKPNGSALDWSLFIGGNGQDTPFALRRDDLGNLYLLGATASPNFPVTPGAYRTRIHPNLADLFLVKLDAETGRIKTSTFLGVGQLADFLNPGTKLAIDPAGGIYVGGTVYDDNFPTTPGAYQTTPEPSSSFGAGHGFLLRLNATVSALVYATFFDAGSLAAMEVDNGGAVAVAGKAFGFPDSRTPAFPAVNPVPGVNQKALFPGQAYVAKLSPNGSALVFASLLHGDDRDSAILDLKIASDGSIHVVGFTSGTRLPEINPFAIEPPDPSGTPLQRGAATPFLAKLSPAGDLVQSTLIFGVQYTPSSGFWLTQKLLLLQNGAPCVMNLGQAAFQQTAGGLGGTSPFSSPAYEPTLACLNAAGTAFALKTRLPVATTYSELTLAADGAALFAGIAAGGFVTTKGVVQPRYGGGVYQGSTNQLSAGDAFILRMSFDNPAPTVRVVVPDAIVLETAGGIRTLDVYGSGFAFGTEATFNGLPARTTFFDSGHISLDNVNFDSLQPGTNGITVSLAGPGGGFSEGALAVFNATPAGTSVSPASVTQGAADAKIVIRASNLGRDSTLYWNGSLRAAQYVADSARGGHFELLLAASDLGQPVTARVAVGNPPPGGGISQEAIFSVQPSAGPGPPTVFAPSGPLVFFDPLSTGARVTFSGGGFVAETKAFWDSREVPAELVSATRIAVLLPPEDLNRWGAHDLYVVNGSLRSATVRVFIGIRVPTRFSASDPVRQRLYVVRDPLEFAGQFDLLTIDLRTGQVLATVPGISASPLAMALTSDGSYLYIATVTLSPALKITRYNTIAGAIDLEWPVDQELLNDPFLTSLVTIPGAPETIVLSVPNAGVTIYDRDRPRAIRSIAAGFQPSDAAAFATSSRIYINRPSIGCWRWMEFDGAGIREGSSTCSTETPADAVRDGGLVYLTDGGRSYPVSVPAPASQSGVTFPLLAADPAHRRAYQLRFAGGSIQIVEFNLDNQQQQIKMQANSVPGSALHVNADGAVIWVGPGFIAFAP